LCQRFYNLHIDPANVHAVNEGGEDDDEAMTLIEVPKSLNETAVLDDEETETLHTKDEEGGEDTTEGEQTKVEALAKKVTVTEKQEADIMLKQCQDVAYCLSQLSFTSTGTLAKLMDCFRFYANKLGDKEVYDNLQSIIAKSRKHVKADHKQQLDDFEVKLKEAREKLVEDQAAHYNASKTDKTKRGKRGGEDVMREVEERKAKKAVEEAAKDEKKVAERKKKAPIKRRKKKTVSSSGEDEDSQTDDGYRSL
jgi:hypothetical protein